MGHPLGGVTYRLAKIEDGSRYLDRTSSSTGEISWEGLDPAFIPARGVHGIGPYPGPQGVPCGAVPRQRQHYLLCKMTAARI